MTLRFLDYEILLRTLMECALLELFVHKVPPRRPEKWKSALVFVTLLAGMSLFKLQRMRFLFDFPISVLIISLYLCLRKRIKPANSLYLSCICFLCLDAGLTIATVIQVLYPAILAQPLLLPLYALISFLLCFFLRSYVVVYVDGHMKPSRYIFLLLPMLPYAYIRASTYVYNTSDLDLYTDMVVILLMAILVTFATVVGNRNYLFAQAERSKRLEIEALLREQHQQYLIKQETMYQVNSKYHELKHYVAAFAAMADSGEARDCLQKLEKGLEPLHSALDTGNAMVDVILFEKTQRCQEKGIRITPYIDARPLSFVQSLDLCTIFGNALDNAIEATAPIADPEKREIHVKVCCHNRLVVMNFTNYFMAMLHMEGENLLSTKTEKGEHGFGIPNMRRAVESYNGALTFEAEGNRFTLHILLPLPENMAVIGEATYVEAQI